MRPLTIFVIQTLWVQACAYPFALLMGTSLAFLAMFVLHDSSHAALTHSPVLWRGLVRTAPSCRAPA